MTVLYGSSSRSDLRLELDLIASKADSVRLEFDVNKMFCYVFTRSLTGGSDRYECIV